MGKSFEHPTGVVPPSKGQPIQGHSGIKVMPDGTYWIITDIRLRFKGQQPRLDGATSIAVGSIGQVAACRDDFLHDPDKKVPFRIAHESTNKRYLTGANF